MAQLTSLHVFLSILVIFLAFKWLNKGNASISPPESHEYVLLTDFLSSSDTFALRKHFEELGSFQTGKADFSSNLYTNIGEAYDRDSSGECFKPGTYFNDKTSKCEFFPRIDILSNYMLGGGYEGYKESQSKLIARITSFINHEFDAADKAEYKNLFEKQLFLDSIHKICPNATYTLPIELNLVIQLPGQLLAAHADAVYFKDATRQTHPLWLLSVMKSSHLFDDTLIHQIQGVLYIGKNNKKGGEMYCYPDGVDHDVVLIPPTERSVIMMDGTEIIHGICVYQPDIEPLEMFRDPFDVFHLNFDKTIDKWRVYHNYSATEYTYDWDDIRGSIAYRALCFDNENEMNQWNQRKMDPDNILTIDEILNKFKNDLISKNRITETKWNIMNKNKYDLGLFLIEEYIKLPKSPVAWIKINYIQIYNYYCTHRGMYTAFTHKILQNLIC